MSSVRPAPDVYSLREVARAAGVTTAQIRTMSAAGRIALLPSGLLSHDEAVRIVRGLQTGEVPARSELFGIVPATNPRHGVPLVASGALHAAIFAALVLMAGLGASSPQAAPREPLKTARLVFLALPGPGGGGGGGGLKQPKPPARAEQKGTNKLRSPVPIQRVARREPARTETPRPTPPPRPVEKPVEPPPAPTRTDPAPPVVAPVATVPADTKDQAGVLNESAPAAGTRGSGEGGGSGTGAGTGIGEGEGPGIGPGSGGGTGGGPYRPGSGITPPELLHEVKPDYTEDARRRNLEGEVVLEIVVRSDGSVGNMRLQRGLGAGLDQRAMEAVRRWRFAPARRHGTPVDVLVEVAVEFRLR
jgi:TonB family protein